MTNINDNYLKLRGAYLFPEIARRVTAFLEREPAAASRIVRCGIGDVTEPLVPAVLDAMHAALDEMGRRETFRGYGPPLGYDFLREAIVAGDFDGLDIAPDEVFISDGSKTDCGAILDVLGTGNRTGITDPVYPVYVDSNVMAGHTGEARDDGSYDGLTYLPCTADNGFVPAIPSAPLDLVYLCYPNNPTGGMITREQLRAWVDYALEHDAIILYDVAYKDFVREADAPRSIYEIDGARRCAMEFHSFSKNGGFTGVRCGYTVCPRELAGRTRGGEEVPLHGLWARRWSTKSNSVGYVVQRGAEALYSEAGRAQTRNVIENYLENARLLREGCRSIGLTVYGGVDAPYVWVTCPDGVDSWGMFDRMLEEANVVVTPGVGFGRCGEGYFRISAFNTRENVEEVVRRMKAMVNQPA
ncbi:MAG: LL-diaminopimelate aminotransferase [Planctomycetes bacterium]|nr:LL-diaminopimelate aminotransferase [Planctomycetota bacterium]